MQFSLKSLVAVGLALASSSALSAVIPLPSTGNGDASLTIVNTQLNTSVIIDLNRTLESLLPNTAGGVLTSDSGHSFTINLGSEVASFLGGGASNYSWWVAAGDSLGAGNFGGRRLLTTGSVGATANITNQGVTQAVNLQDQFLTTLNGACPTGANCFAALGDAAWGGNRPSGTEWDTRWNNNLNAALNNGSVGLGSSQGFFYYATNSNTTGALSATRTAYANSLGLAATWTLSLQNGQALLTYNSPAAVPLPAAAWLLLSGLAGMGAVSRRRKA